MFAVQGQAFPVHQPFMVFDHEGNEQSSMVLHGMLCTDSTCETCFGTEQKMLEQGLGNVILLFG